MIHVEGSLKHLLRLLLTLSILRHGSNELDRSSVPARSSPVMLSAAKHLSAHRARPFAVLRVTLCDYSNCQGLFFTIEPCLIRETHHYYSYVCFHTNITRHSFCTDPRSKTLLPHDMLLLYIGYSGTVYHSTQIPSRKKMIMKRLPIQRQVCCMQGR